jgi:N-acyl-D-aspartate/D-glutamate deacylase
VGGRTVFHGGTVFDGTGADLAHADVLIEDGRIVEVGSDIDADGGIDCAGGGAVAGRVGHADTPAKETPRPYATTPTR